MLGFDRVAKCTDRTKFHSGDKRIVSRWRRTVCSAWEAKAIIRKHEPPTHFCAYLLNDFIPQRPDRKKKNNKYQSSCTCGWVKACGLRARAAVEGSGAMKRWRGVAGCGGGLHGRSRGSRHGDLAAINQTILAHVQRTRPEIPNEPVQLPLALFSCGTLASLLRGAQS